MSVVNSVQAQPASIHKIKSSGRSRTKSGIMAQSLNNAQKLRDALKYGDAQLAADTI